jgi:hypothetical protein
MKQYLFYGLLLLNCLTKCYDRNLLEISRVRSHIESIIDLRNLCVGCYEVIQDNNDIDTESRKQLDSLILSAKRYIKDIDHLSAKVDSYYKDKSQNTLGELKNVRLRDDFEVHKLSNEIAALSRKLTKTSCEKDLD